MKIIYRDFCSERGVWLQSNNAILNKGVLTQWQNIPKYKGKLKKYWCTGLIKPFRPKVKEGTNCKVQRNWSIDPSQCKPSGRNS